MARGQDKKVTLAIRGAPDALAKGTLFISGPVVASGNPTLFMAAPAGLTMPLVIGFTSYGSGTATLYMDGVATSDPTADDYQGYATLVIKPTPNASDSSTMSLYLETHQIGSGINTSPLFLSGTSPFSINKSADLAVRGVHAGDGPSDPLAGEFEGSVSLYIKHNEMLSDNMPLHIDKDFNTANTATLYINHRMGSGHLPLVMESTYVSNDNISLSIKPPASGNMTLYTRGYLE
jgi:hypothetical protein